MENEFTKLFGISKPRVFFFIKSKKTQSEETGLKKISNGFIVQL